MTQQPFDPMDKLLREALASDALPPSDLTDRIMAQVKRTPPIPNAIIRNGC